MSTIDDKSGPDSAEATDGDALGENPFDDSLPGTVGFPPDTPSGLGPTDSVEDIAHHDSLAERSGRQEATNQPPPHEVVRLQDPDSGKADHEAQLIGDSVPPVGQVSPEEAAMHIVNEQSDEA